MKAVFLSILLVISGAFAGCLNFDDDEEPEFFGEVYWQENGVALIWVDEWLYYGLPKINGGCDEWNVILDAEIRVCRPFIEGRTPSIFLDFTEVLWQLNACHLGHIVDWW